MSVFSPRSGTQPRFGGVQRVLRTVRRQVLIRRRALAAGCAALAVFAALEVVRPPAPEKVTAVVAARDLPAGTQLSGDDLTTTSWAPGSLPEGVVAQPTGRVLASPVRRGEAITDARVLGAGLTLTGTDSVALAVRISDTASVDLVRLGDAVQVIAVPAAGGTQGAAAGYPRGRIVLDDARVLALPATKATDASGLSQARVVVLEVPRTKTVEISEAAARDWLSVVLNQ